MDTTAEVLQNDHVLQAATETKNLPLQDQVQGLQINYNPMSQNNNLNSPNSNIPSRLPSLQEVVIVQDGRQGKGDFDFSGNNNPVHDVATIETMVVEPLRMALAEREKKIRSLESEIAQLKSQLDKFQSVFPFRVQTPGVRGPPTQRQRAQGISAEPQSESAVLAAGKRSFPKVEKDERNDVGFDVYRILNPNRIINMFLSVCSRKFIEIYGCPQSVEHFMSLEKLKMNLYENLYHHTLISNCLKQELNQEPCGFNAKALTTSVINKLPN
ncbi:uncharacterized protein LOC113383450 [Ctenocephalides felis]|uniref:uncharacterized protein LOC113383450 n=1 Tax=Ctenocephalides felis TaxID=7515 RepID=UPI000E6E4F76|nr:uncharacterized protein LOC113383450 [Ctenocephalides felis]